MHTKPCPQDPDCEGNPACCESCKDYWAVKKYKRFDTEIRRFDKFALTPLDTPYYREWERIVSLNSCTVAEIAFLTHGYYVRVMLAVALPLPEVFYELGCDNYRILERGHFKTWTKAFLYALTQLDNMPFTHWETWLKGLAE